MKLVLLSIPLHLLAFSIMGQVPPVNSGTATYPSSGVICTISLCPPPVTSVSIDGGGAQTGAVALTTKCLPGYTVTPITTGNWSTLGSGGTRINGTSPCGGAISVVGNTGATNVYGVTHTVSAGNFSYTLIIQVNIPVPGGGGGTPTVMIVFTDGTKLEGCGELLDLADAGFIVAPAGYNVYKNTALTGGTISGANGGVSSLVNQYPAPNPGLIQAVLTRTGTSLSCALYYDGTPLPILSTTIFTDTVPFLTASSIGVISDPRGSANAMRFTLISSTLQ